MAGLAFLLRIGRKYASVERETLHSTGLFSATLAASSAAAYVAGSTYFASRISSGFGGIGVALCDAGATSSSLAEDYCLTSSQTEYGTIFLLDTLSYRHKEYYILQKPLWSAFEASSFGLTSLRCFLYFCLSVLGKWVDKDEADLNDNGVDLVLPLKNTAKRMVLEISVVTTQRVLERLSVYFFTPRMAWKLLKDVPKSVVRKANRGMPFYTYFVHVSRTSFRGQFLGAAALWLVQVGIHCHHSRRPIDRNNIAAIFNPGPTLFEKIVIVTVQCGVSLVCASIGAGIGAALFRPSAGQYVGSFVGELMAPIIVSFCIGHLWDI